MIDVTFRVCESAANPSVMVERSFCFPLGYYIPRIGESCFIPESQDGPFIVKNVITKWFKNPVGEFMPHIWIDLRH